VAYPDLLPADGASYSMVSGMYSGSSDSDPAATVDGIYATDGRPGTLTTDPATLVSTALSSIDASDTQPYATGTHGGALQCGVWATSPVCVWADTSTEVFVFFDGGSGTSASLSADAATTLQIRNATER
jgi:hypothetical protein